ncbi:MAG TPA: hypothetical protein VMD49_01405 [Steroidobacteraceae bacterium]|jgi:hypothetical protein|nr:hypothetical protein [Steroidobacteraceae bacterium]
MWRSGVIGACACVLALAASAPSAHAASAAAATPVTWATWITRDVEVNLQNLPKAYSCDDLWYKLHGILLAIGAREYMSITPYGCGAKASGAGRSPTLDLKFQTLRVLTGADARWAQTKAARRTVRLGPGEPKTLDASDCALLSQLSGTLFSYLDMHVVTSDLECSAPQSAHGFSIVVDAIVALPTGHSPA